jgi:hypothetical protein
LVAIPCIRAVHLNADERRLVRLALTRLGEKGQWALPELKAELIELVDAGIEIEQTAFTVILGCHLTGGFRLRAFSV